jgi:hypothetical protein
MAFLLESGSRAIPALSGGADMHLPNYGDKLDNHK